jgi:arylsulfatase A-like enzyme
MERTNLALAAVLGSALIAAAAAVYITGATEAPQAPTSDDIKADTKPPFRSARLNVGKIKLTPTNVKIGIGGKLRAPPEPTLEQKMRAPTGPPPEGDRILFVTWDTVRADHVSAYGYPRPTTPTFDALAAEGLLFERFIVPQSTTLPTHVSLFTGAHPDEHGVLANSASGRRRFVAPEQLPPLAQHLHEAGYWTAAFVSSTPLKDFSGIATGFQAWSQPEGRQRPGMRTTEEALSWLEEVPEDRPFLLWVHYYDPHHPYRMPPGYQGKVPDVDAVDVLLEERGLLTGEQEMDERVKGRIERYDAEIRYVDKQLADLLAALETRGFSDDTVVVVAGDHGEGLGQHDHLQHGLVWPEQTAAPLAIRAPGTAPRRVKTLTSAQDVLPTLASVADLPDEARLLAGASGRNVLDHPEGQESVPILTRTSMRQLKELKGHPAHGGGNHDMAWALHTDTEMLVYVPEGEHELYDTTTDPYATKNIAGERPERVAELVKQIEALHEKHAARAAAIGAGRTEPLDDRTIEDLEALGYVQ